MTARGFTLIEILIVVAVLGLVIAMGLPVYERFIERSRVAETVVQIGTMSTLLRNYQVAKGALPDDLSDLKDGETPLSEKRDPWGLPYEYFNLTSAKGNGQARKDKKLAPLNSDFDLYSRGRDQDTHASLGNSRSRDDVVRARDGRFVGLAEEFDP